jgi:hypothetical protein
MSDVRKISTALGALSVLLFTYSASAYVIGEYDLTGIPASGSPYFEHGVSVKMDDKKGKLTVKQSVGAFTFFDNSDLWNGTGAHYVLKVNYTNSGEFIDGSLQIKGEIDGLGIRKNTTLVTAGISGWNVTEDENLWGFATSDIVCSPLLLIECTLNESVYIALDEAFDGSFNNGKFESLGTAVTTVPVPAAAWLFGSALVLLGWVRRRKPA